MHAIRIRSLPLAAHKYITAPPVLLHVLVHLTWPALCVIAMSGRDSWAIPGFAREQLLPIGGT